MIFLIIFRILSRPHARLYLRIPIRQNVHFYWLKAKLLDSLHCLAFGYNSSDTDNRAGTCDVKWEPSIGTSVLRTRITLGIHLHTPACTQ